MKREMRRRWISGEAECQWGCMIPSDSRPIKTVNNQSNKHIWWMQRTSFSDNLRTCPHQRQSLGWIQPLRSYHGVVQDDLSVTLKHHSEDTGAILFLLSRQVQRQSWKLFDPLVRWKRRVRRARLCPKQCESSFLVLWLPLCLCEVGCNGRSRGDDCLELAF